MAEPQIFAEGDALDVRQADFPTETWRQAALGSAHTPKLLREFRRHCGAAAEELFEIYFTFLRVLGKGSRHRLRHPGCPGMTPDEIQILSLLAAAQTGHWILFEPKQPQQ